MLKRMRNTNPWGFTKRWAGHIWYSFTVQLLVLQARNHFAFVGFWIFLLALVNGSIGAKYGIQYLFLDAEYIGQHGFWSFFFIGMGFGTFFLTWNMTLYLLGAHHFPFLAAIEQPFTKFCLNNFPIPTAFLLHYLGILVHFQSQRDDAELLLLFETALGLLIGLIAVIILYLLYFFYTNHDIVYYEKKNKTRLNLAPHLGPGYRGTSQELELLREVKWPVKTYLNELLVTKRVRSVAHYNIHLLRRIFRQNHLNALLIQTLSIMILAALGWLTDDPAFRLPAGASIFFLFSILTAILGAISFWFHAWRLSIFVVLLILLNYLTGFDAVHRKSLAAGLDYQKKYAPYNYPALWRLCDSSQVKTDYDSTLQILERWKNKAQKSPQDKPQMVLVCTSGGGLRASIWSMQVMRTLDSLNNNDLLRNTVLMTGASGGMLGMAYLRELSLQQKLGKIPNWRADHYLDCMSKDLLNAPAFTLLAHDLFWPFGNIKINGKSYTRNRGTVFDKQLDENTGGLLDKPISQYRDLEASAQIPMLYLTPSVVNDVRQMIISPQGVSFMMASPLVLERGTHMEIDAVDFRAMFKQQGADQLSFLTALRMNATYPVILPSVFLPSKPEVEIMDAGIIDNYGLHTITRFLQVFESWIKANTSGVLILQISTTPKFEGIPASDKKGVVSTLFNPLEIAGKWFHRQEFSQDSGLSFLYRIYGEDFLHHLSFEYKPNSKDQIKASVSFHLTDFERKAVMNAIDRPNNREQLEKFVHLFGKLSEQK